MDTDNTPKINSQDGLATADNVDDTKTITVNIVEGICITDEEEALLTQERAFTNETEVQQSRRLFQENAPAAVKTIIMLAKHGSQERIRLQAAQYVVERILGRVQDNPPTPEADPYKELIAECVRFVEETSVPESLEKEDNNELES